MTTEKSLAGGTKVQKCIIEGLTSTSTSYTFHDVRGLLYSTQFAQPALVLMQMAVFADMKSKGLIQKNAAFAGHSLGEYAALGAMTEFLPLEPLLDLVFYRGLVMQSAIEKDSLGQSDFSMVAVNPSRLSKGEHFLHFSAL
jgi:fatty acid synthase subunit beta, fungi type